MCTTCSCLHHVVLFKLRLDCLPAEPPQTLSPAPTEPPHSANTAATSSFLSASILNPHNPIFLQKPEGTLKTRNRIMSLPCVTTPHGFPLHCQSKLRDDSRHSPLAPARPASRTSPPATLGRSTMLASYIRLPQGLWGFPGLVSIRRDPTQRSSRMRKGKSEEQIQIYSRLGGQLVFQVNRQEPAFSFAPPSASACSAAGRARTQLDFCR